MKDQFERNIDYLRISITDRCNLSCTYCVPPRGTRPVRDEDLLSVEEIAGVARSAIQQGFRKFRLTGGEPLIRPEVIDIVAELAAIDGVDDLSMTTNGVHLADFAGQLAQAGLDRVNVSLDTVDPERYELITEHDRLLEVFEGIAAAQEAGLCPVKLNCVIMVSPEEPDAKGVAAFAAESGCEARFIQRMNLETGRYGVVEPGGGGDCPRCNRIRLTCDGRFKPCLFSDLSYSIRELGIDEALQKAIETKPESGRTCRQHDFCAVGG